MAVIIGSARSDENNGAKGGRPGDQKSGKEVSTQNWYIQPSNKTWRVFRCIDPDKAAKIAYCMKAACDNNNIGYDQGDRLTLFNEAKKVGFDCAKVTKPVETDCSALVRVCCYYAGIEPANFTTPNEPTRLLNTGAFVELTGDKYQKSSDYLRKGDILVTKVSGHTVVVLTDGPKAEMNVPIPGKGLVLGARVLAIGSEGKDVKELQEALISLGYSVGKDGADGDFGENTEKAIIAFQKDNNLVADGEFGENTFAKLTEKINHEDVTNKYKVQILSGSWYIRTKPSVLGRVLGTAKKGQSFIWDGETDGNWYRIIYENGMAWVSGKQASLVRI